MWVASYHVAVFFLNNKLMRLFLLKDSGKRLAVFRSLKLRHSLPIIILESVVTAEYI